MTQKRRTANYALRSTASRQQRNPGRVKPALSKDSPENRKSKSFGQISFLNVLDSSRAAGRELTALLEPFLLQSYPAGISKGLFGGFSATALGSRSENQDRVCISHFSAKGKAVTVACLADGIGGLRFGAECASLAVASFVAAVYVGSISGESDPFALCAASTRFANSMTFERFRGKSGSTIAAIVFYDSFLAAAYAGDSRVLGITSDEKLHLLSIDDTMAARYGALPGLDPSLANSRGLLQFVGMGDDFTPHVQNLAAQSYRRFILASDGISVIPSDLVERLARLENARLVARRLVTISSWEPHSDNSTVAVLDVNHLRSQSSLALSIEDPTGVLTIPTRHVEITTSSSEVDIIKSKRLARKKRGNTAAKVHEGGRPILEIND